MTRQTDHADIVGKVFAAELRAETKVLRLQQQLLLHLHVAERPPCSLPSVGRPS